MTAPTSEQVIDWAHGAGFTVRNGVIKAVHSNGSWVELSERLAEFAAIAFAAGQAAEREAAQEMLDAAIAVIKLWDSPLWKDLPPTAKAIARLRDAVNKLEGDAEAEANSRRVVACLTACAGISTENLEDNLSVKELADRYNAVLEQRDELLAACEGVIKWDKARKFPIPYRVRDPIHSAIASVKGGAE